MGFYGDQVLPRMMSWALGTRAIADERKTCLAGVRGTVLEVGFGSGLNLPWYPAGIERLVAVDPSRTGARLARRRIAAAPFAVEHVALAGEVIDAPDASFDSVVSTFTLCTVDDPAAALGQILRVLRPEGRFFFLEHGLAPDPGVRRWQGRLNGLQQALCGGCHLDRDIGRLVREAGFAIDQVDQHYLRGSPRTHGFLTRGIARRAGP
jgi:SAM-dependent methyltransferase